MSARKTDIKLERDKNLKKEFDDIQKQIKDSYNTLENIEKTYINEKLENTIEYEETICLISNKVNIFSRFLNNNYNVDLKNNLDKLCFKLENIEKNLKEKNKEYNNLKNEIKKINKFLNDINNSSQTYNFNDIKEYLKNFLQLKNS